MSTLGWLLSRRRPHSIGAAHADGIPRREFPSEDGAFADRIPMIISESAGFANDAMAWDDKGNRIGADRAPDRASSLRLANCFSEASISRERARWNAQQSAPDA